MAQLIKILGSLIALMVIFSCGGASDSNNEELELARLRQKMVDTQLRDRDITDSLVLKAMEIVPRHLFIPQHYRSQAYHDGPLPIGADQTISQPYIVAIMTQLLRIDSTARVLEIGTGSGYQAAVLAEITDSVYTIEIIPQLATRADSLLDSLDYRNIQTRIGDGYLGWPEAAPFDGIIVTAAAPRIPQPLVDQLKEGGRMVIPVGDYYQELIIITKTGKGYTTREIFPVRFVPMTGKIQTPGKK